MDALYTYGGGHVLYKIFDGLGAISQSPDFWQNFFYAPVVIGLIWAGTIALAKADIKHFALKWFLPVFIILELMIVPKTSLHIVDSVDPTFGYGKIDDLPIGLVTVMGLSSHISRSLTEMLEDVYSTSDLTRFTKSGFAFSSRLTQEARTLRIKDPRIRKNVKDWMDQCIWLPYLKTNIGGKRQSALDSNDIVDWVSKNGHPSLGTYWEEEDGSRTYQTCKAAAKIIQPEMRREGQKSISSLGAKLFGVSPKGVDGRLFAPMMKEAWQTLSNSTKSAHAQAQQIMLVNAQKESFDDRREQAKYPRLHPELVSMNAARALDSQAKSGFISSVIAGASLPLIQATLTALFAVMFFILLPFFFLPGGFGKLLMWTKVMVSLQMWPVLSSVLNAIALMWLERSAEVISAGTTGFTIATTTGFADAAWNVGAWAGGLQLTVPFLSWALVSGSQYALTSVIGGITSSVSGSASKYASDSTDGNLSIGNHNIMNETLASRSVTQQNHVGSSNFADTVNTGSQTITTDLQGNQYSTQMASQLATNISSSNALSAVTSKNARESEQLMESRGKAYTDSLTDTSTKILSLSDKHSKGMNLTEGLNKQESATFNKSLDEFKSAQESFSKAHNISAQSAVSASVGINSSGSLLGGVAEKVLGIKAGVDMKGDAVNSEAMNKALNSDEGKRLSESLQKVQQYSKSYGSQITDSEGQEAVSTVNDSFYKTKVSSDSLNSSYTQSQNWEKVQSFSDSKGLNVQSNENDAWLDYVAQNQGISKVDAVSYVGDNNNAASVSTLQSQFISEKAEALKSYVSNAGHVLSDNEIKNWQSQTPVLNETGSENRHNLRQEIAKQGFKTHLDIDNQTRELAQDYDMNSVRVDSQHGSEKGSMDKHNETYRKEHAGQNEKSNDTRLGEKGWKDVKSDFGFTEANKNLRNQ